MVESVNDEQSITVWLHRAKSRNPHAQQQLWIRYYERLIRVARTKLSARDRRVADEDDVVAEAFDAFFRALEGDRLTNVQDRDDLWRLLVTITDNKARDLMRHARRKKRGSGGIRGHSVMRGGIDESVDGFHQVPDPSPEFANDFRLSCEHLLSQLQAEHRQIAIWKLEGWTNKEIGERLGCLEESVRRKVVLIRSVWEGERGASA